MNWFKKHLNWTYGFGGGILFVIGLAAANIPSIVSLLFWVIYAVGLIWLSWWILKEKNRPLWISILSPSFLGWLYILCCDNRSEAVLAARDEQLGDIKSELPADWRK